MLKFLTSLSFLYLVVIAILVVYGCLYHRDFKRGKLRHRRFSLIFLVIGTACLSFLWVNIHAPLRLKTFSNLDHHFIRHDGFEFTEYIELGEADTANYQNNAFNRFRFSGSDGSLTVNSSYSEEPFYLQGASGYRIASVCFPAIDRLVSFYAGNMVVSIGARPGEDFHLQIGDSVFAVKLRIKKGITAWGLFKDNDQFINSGYYNDERLVGGLKNIYFLRDDVSRKDFGDLKIFISGKLFRYSKTVLYNGKPVEPAHLQFSANLADKTWIAWGFGFLTNNRNQLQVHYISNNRYALTHRYPIAYPLTEEAKNDWTSHQVTKFLVSGEPDMNGLPTAFKEGFLFAHTSTDAGFGFSPVLLSYRKDGKNKPLDLTTTYLQSRKTVAMDNGRFFLPAGNGGFKWIFSITNSFDWQFSGFILSSDAWQTWIFVSLGFFMILVILTGMVKHNTARSWVWHLLAAVVMVLLTTRFFLYWRYKSFPPFEGMDLPSQQQLESFSNFGVIMLAAILLALFFGYGFLVTACNWTMSKFFSLPSRQKHTKLPGQKFPDRLKGIFPAAYSFFTKFNPRALFFTCWLLLLVLAGLSAALNNFDPGVCRRVAIGLTILWFVFLFISYRFSPLVQPAEKSWWGISTGRLSSIAVSNPVKIILSVTLLALFAFIDIGFAIVFFNFLIFNEAFLCINYGIAGLSAGSNRNAAYFRILGLGYLVFFVLNLFFAPYIFKLLLNMPGSFYVAGYGLFAIIMSYLLLRVVPLYQPVKRRLVAITAAIAFFAISFLFFPKERILDKAAMTKYRIDVLTMPVDKSILTAYDEGKNYEPVIRAAQNQWFINTFIDEENNSNVQSAGFNLLQHAPQNKGARYNAQATDLVASRFLVAEHGKWAVLLYVLLLMMPGIMLASFYKLYPDFTNRTNAYYPGVTIGFSILNYLLITALLVILAATGRYIFFGQDLPFASILSKQSILFPCLLILAVVFLFRNVPQQQYSNNSKRVPGTVVLLFLLVLLFFFKPSFNKNKEFGVANLAGELEGYVQFHLQPLIDHIDTAARSRKFTLAKKDQIFTDSLRKMITAGLVNGGNNFFTTEINAYARSGFARHLDQRNMLYLDLYSGKAQLAVNYNYFRVEPPPHLQQLWTGNVFGDSSICNVSVLNVENGDERYTRITDQNEQTSFAVGSRLELALMQPVAGSAEILLLNKSGTPVHLKQRGRSTTLEPGGRLSVGNPSRWTIAGDAGEGELVLTIEPDAFMKNYYVNGSRYYVYPMKEKFIWARNFAESVASDFTGSPDINKHAYVSLDFALMDSLSEKIARMMASDTDYASGAEYGVTIADGNGRIVAMADHIKGLQRIDPNNKPAFNKMIQGENGVVSQSLLRKQVGNINLLRMNPGPGSTFKPIVFSAIASQLNIDWDGFAAEGFDEKQNYFGGEKVPEYDFEKNNGRISRVSDYLKYSDNYYHANVLLLGSYPKQDPRSLLSSHFINKKPGAGLHWPYFTYSGKQYWLNGFRNWPGYQNGQADFGNDSSFTSIGLLNNYNIYTRPVSTNFDLHFPGYDSSLFKKAYRRSAFILPEYSLFDLRGNDVDHRIPYDLFTTCFRGHVKGSSQVLVSPARMLEAFGKMVSQSRNYHLTFDPHAGAAPFRAFDVDESIPYNSYLSVMRDNVFMGMKQALFSGTAARLGRMLKDGTPYYYYAKTGTTGDDAVKTKSKLLAIIISSKDLTDPDFNFRDNKFYMIYFTSQNGPAKQNEDFQSAVIRYLQESAVFNRYMKG